MQIVCPHCITSFAIDRRAIGADGRTVRCARCKGTWFALPADARDEPALALAEAAPAAPAAAARAAHAPPPVAPTADAGAAGDIPTVESPPIAGNDIAPETAVATLDAVAAAPGTVARGRKPRSRRPRQPARRGSRAPRRRIAWWPAACLATGLAVLSLLIWRAELVRLLPQTAPLFRAIGLDVNLRGLAFRDVRTVRDTVAGTPVLIVEGAVASVARNTVEVPRLRFSIRDAGDVEIYAWSATLERTTLAAGDSARFRSQLADPPGEGRRVEVRFLGRHDLGV